MYCPSSFKRLNESEVKNKVKKYWSNGHGYHMFERQDGCNLCIGFHIADIGLVSDPILKIVVDLSVGWWIKGDRRAICQTYFGFDVPKTRTTPYYKEAFDLINELALDAFFLEEKLLEGQEVLVYKDGDTGRTTWKSYSKEVSYVDDGYNYETETIVGRTSEYIPPQPIKKFIYTRSGTPFYPRGGI